MSTNQSKSTLKWIDYSDDSQQSEQENQGRVSIPSLKEHTISKQEIRDPQQKEPEMRKIKSQYQRPAKNNLTVEQSKKKIEQWERQQIWLFVSQPGVFRGCFYTAMKNDPKQRIKVYKSKVQDRGSDLKVPVQLAKALIQNGITAIIDYLKKFQQAEIPNFSEQQLKTAVKSKIVIHERNFHVYEKRDKDSYGNNNRNYNNKNRQQGDRKGRTRYENNDNYQPRRNTRRQEGQKKRAYVDKQTGEAPQNKKNLTKKLVSENQRKYSKKQAAIRGQELAFFRNKAPQEAIGQEQKKPQKNEKVEVPKTIQEPIKQRKEPWVRKENRQEDVPEIKNKKSYKSKQDIQISIGTKKPITEEQIPKNQKQGQRNYQNRDYQNDRSQRNYQTDRDSQNERNYQNQRNYKKEQRVEKPETFNKQPYQKRNYKEKDSNSNNYKQKNTKAQSYVASTNEEKKPEKIKNQNRYAAMMSDDSQN